MIYCVLWGGIWSEPLYIAPGSSPELAVDNKGVCWCNTSSRYFYTFRNEVTGWQYEMETPIPGHPYFDKGDTLWITRSLLFEGIQYVRYDGESWSDEAFIPTYTTLDGGEMLTVDSGDGVWVAWTTPWFGYQTVGCTRYQNGLWGEPQILTDTMEEVDHIGLSITTDALGRIWIGWREIDWEKMPDTTIHHVKAKYWDGESWSDEILIATHDWNWAAGPTLAPDKEGGMWALWVHEPEDAAQLLLKTRHWDGVEWSPVDTVAVAGKYYLCFPKGGFVVDSNNNAWTAWRQAVEPNDTSGDIYYSVNEGHGWSEPAPVNENPAVDQYPDIAVDGAGRIWCVWSSNREGEDEWDYSIWASYATGVGVEEPITHQPPSLTIDKSVGGEFTFSVSHSNIVRGIIIYDASGRMVRSLSIERGTVLWDGSDRQGRMLPAGVYFVRYRGGTTGLKKIVLIR